MMSSGTLIFKEIEMLLCLQSFSERERNGMCMNLLLTLCRMRKWLHLKQEKRRLLDKVIVIVHNLSNVWTAN